MVVRDRRPTGATCAWRPNARGGPARAEGQGRPRRGIVRVSVIGPRGAPRGSCAGAAAGPEAGDEEGGAAAEPAGSAEPVLAGRRRDGTPVGLWSFMGGRRLQGHRSRSGAETSRHPRHYTPLDAARAAWNRMESHGIAWNRVASRSPAPSRAEPHKPCPAGSRSVQRDVVGTDHRAPAGPVGIDVALDLSAVARALDHRAKLGEGAAEARSAVTCAAAARSRATTSGGVCAGTAGRTVAAR